MKRGRGCECVMHELALLQPIHTQNDAVAVVASRRSPASKPPHAVRRRRWEGLEGKGVGDIAGVEGEAEQGCGHASAWEKSENPPLPEEESGRPVRSRKGRSQGASNRALDNGMMDSSNYQTPIIMLLAGYDLGWSVVVMRTRRKL